MNVFSGLVNFARDVRLVGRQMASSPTFWISATLTLGIAIGFNAAILSLVNAVLMKPLSRDDPDRVVRLYAQTDQRPSSPAFSYLDFRTLQEAGADLTGVSATHLATLVLSDGRRTDQVLGEIASGSYFGLLGVSVIAGRPIGPADDAATAAPVALVSEHYWRHRLGAETEIVGRPVTISGRAFTIVGIVSDDFRGTFVGGNVDLWLPLEPGLPLLGANVESGTVRPLQILARLRDGVSHQQAARALGLLADEIARNRTESGTLRLEVVPGTLLHGRARRMAMVFLSLLAAMVALVLLIAASNVANLLFARALGRRREMAIRVSIGAGRLRIVQQLTAESLVLAAGALIIALAMTWWIAAAFRAVVLLPGVELRLDLAPDVRVFVATAAVALATGLLTTLLPAVAVTRGDVVALLREGGASLSGRRTVRLRKALVAIQVGVAVVVCVAAGLLTKSGRAAAAIDLGIDRTGVFATDIDLDPLGYSGPRAVEFYRTLLGRVASLPEVAHVALASRAPLDSSTPTVRILRNEEASMTRPDATAAGVETTFYVVTSGYFPVVGVPLIAGRDFTETDRDGAPPRAIANEFLVAALWPGLPSPHAVGRRVRLGRLAAAGAAPSGDVEIVGVARNAKYRTIGEPNQPHLYLPYAQHFSASMTLLVRSKHAAIPAREVHRALAAVDRDVYGFFTRTLEEHTAVSLLPAVVAARVSVAVGVVSTLLGAIGLYGLIAGMVAERKREFGLRMALGASAGTVSSAVVRQALALAGVGGAGGVLAALLGGRLLRSFLYGVSPADPITFALVVVGAVMVSTMAAWFPARRAGGVDPSIALKS